jgi:UrcA family protein
MNTMTPAAAFRRLITTAILSAFALSFAGVCTAAGPTDAPHTIVKFGDLAVSTSLGATALYARLRVAAEQVCPLVRGGDLASKARANACVHKAIKDAVTSIDQPALFAVYGGKNGEPTAIVLAASQGR